MLQPQETQGYNAAIRLSIWHFSGSQRVGFLRLEHQATLLIDCTYPSIV